MSAPIATRQEDGLLTELQQIQQLLLDLVGPYRDSSTALLPPPSPDYAIAVTIRLPEYHRGASRVFVKIWRTPLATLLVDEVSHWSFETLWVPLPWEIKCFGAFFVACIDYSVDRNYEELLSELLGRGYADAITTAESTPFAFALPDEISGVREKRVKGIEGRADDSKSTGVNTNYVSEETLVTRYHVQFPFFRRNGTSSLDADFILVHMEHPYRLPNDGYVYRSNTTQYLEIPEQVDGLERVDISLAFSDVEADVEQLVFELIQYGCGYGSFEQRGSLLPSRLSSGGIVVHRGLESPASQAQCMHDSQKDSNPGSGPDPPEGQQQSDEKQHPLFVDAIISNMMDLSSPTSITASSLATFATARSTFDGPINFYSTRPSLATQTDFSPAMAHSRNPKVVYIASDGDLVRIKTHKLDMTPIVNNPQEEDFSSPSIASPLQELRKDYQNALRQQNLIQPFEKELNWSGKGQHVTFMSPADVPLKMLSFLGSSNTAIVEKVLCRRIALARKSMRCNRSLSITDALCEVVHLHNLRHFHIVQLVGSYLQGRLFSILMYPVADQHLGLFLEDTSDMQHPAEAAIDLEISLQYQYRLEFLASTLSCLTSAVAYIHEQTTKHMDIKPQNILVRAISPAHLWRIYLADFGLSRSFSTLDHSQTDGPTSRTPRYCAPEVYSYEQRGRSADIFSLGCVFLEILTVYTGNSLQDFSDKRRGDGDNESFHANLENVFTWIDNPVRSSGRLHDSLVDHVEHMLYQTPAWRPRAADLQRYFKQQCVGMDNDDLDPFAAKSCCTRAPEPYEAYVQKVDR